MKIEKISLGLPCYNEEKNISKVINNCLDIFKKNKIVKFEIIVVDNKSTDNSLSIIKKIKKLKKNKFKIKLIENKKNIFYSGSTNKIIEQAKFDNIVIMDSDDQYDPKDIIKIYKYFKKNNFDLVIGRRAKRNDSLARKFISIIFLILSKLLIGNNLHDLNCGLKILKRKIKIKKYIEFYLNFSNPELFVKYKKNGFKISEYNINHFNREFGNSIHNFSNLLRTFFKVFKYLLWLRKFKTK